MTAVLALRWIAAAAIAAAQFALLQNCGAEISRSGRIAIRADVALRRGADLSGGVGIVVCRIDIAVVVEYGIVLR